jgi:hypothetical protein
VLRHSKPISRGSVARLAVLALSWPLHLLAANNFQSKIHPIVLRTLCWDCVEIFDLKAITNMAIKWFAMFLDWGLQESDG